MCSSDLIARRERAFRAHCGCGLERRRQRQSTRTEGEDEPMCDLTSVPAARAAMSESCGNRSASLPPIAPNETHLASHDRRADDPREALSVLSRVGRMRSSHA